MPQLEILAIAVAPTFVVNTAANEVAINMPSASPATYGTFQNAVFIPRSYFGPKDHYTIKSIWLRLPYCFTMSTGICSIQLALKNAGLLPWQPIAELGFDGQLYIPEPDVEIALDIRCEWNPPIDTIRAAIVLTKLLLNVSMVGVPAALNGTTQEVQFGLKILHTLDMQP